MDEFVYPRPKIDVSHEVNCKMNANAKCIFPNELNSQPFTMPKPNFLEVINSQFRTEIRVELLKDLAICILHLTS